MGVITVRARIASTLPVARYPGWRISREALVQMATELVAGTVPMVFEHDVTDRLNADIVAAEVVDIGDDEAALEAEFEIDADAWQRLQDRFQAAGVRGGFSFSAASTQAVPADGLAPAVTIAADAAAWSDAERLEAARSLAAVAPTQIDRLFQYSAIELAAVFLILKDVGLGVLGNAAFEALKSLMSRRPEVVTRIEIHRPRADGTVAKAVVVTSDPEVVRVAIEALAPAPLGDIAWYDTEKRLWLDH